MREQYSERPKRERAVEYSRRLFIKISPALDAKLHQLARRHDMSVSELTRAALRNVISQIEAGEWMV
jgi:hypothetical protein